MGDTGFEALEGIRMLSYWGLTSEIIQFDPAFPVIGEFTAPAKSETRLLTFLDVLENMLRNASKEPEVVTA